MKVVCLMVCDLVQAEASKALLEANGIPAEVAPYTEAAVSAVTGGTGALGLLVRDVDAQTARELLGLGEAERQAEHGLGREALPDQASGRGQFSRDQPAKVGFPGQTPGGTPLSAQERIQVAERGLQLVRRGMTQILLGVALNLVASGLAQQGQRWLVWIVWGLILMGGFNLVEGLRLWWQHRD